MSSFSNNNVKLDHLWNKAEKLSQNEYVSLIIDHIKSTGKKLKRLKEGGNDSNHDHVRQKDILLESIVRAKALLPGGDLPGKLKKKRKRESYQKAYNKINNNKYERKTCKFYVERKHRCCHFLAIEGGVFCPMHIEDGVERVKCPFNPNHAVLKKKLKLHLLRCNDRNKGGVNEMYYKKNINLFPSALAASPSTKIQYNGKKKKKLEFSECLHVLNLLKNMINRNKFVKRFFPIKESIIKPIECKALFEKKSNLKHVIQNSSIAGHVQACCGNVKNGKETTNSKLVVIEVGAGKGFLSLAIQKTINNAKHFILIDNQHFRNRADKALKDSNVIVERQYIDLKDLFLENTPSLKADYHYKNNNSANNSSSTDNSDKVVKNKSLIFVGKHVCGVATCYTLNCIARILLLKKREITVAGVAIATCCHHKCIWDHYVNQAFFVQSGFTPYDFYIMTRMSSWAVSGNHNIDNDQGGNRYNDLENRKRRKIEIQSETTSSSIDSSADKWWDTNQKREIGNMCKTMMDVGRALLFHNQGYTTDIVKYIDDATSMENRLLRINI